MLSVDSQKSEDTLRQVIDTLPTLVWCTRPDGSTEFLNKRWHDYTGCSPEESRVHGWQPTVHPEDLPRVVAKGQELLASGQPGEVEARIRRRDGVFRWFLMRVEPLRDETGKIVRWYGTQTDIDNLKQIEEKLREEDRELRRITDAIPQTIVVIDPAASLSMQTRRCSTIRDSRPKKFLHPASVNVSLIPTGSKSSKNTARLVSRVDFRSN